MQERALETRTRLTDAAITCFVESGYDATSVQTICERAGASKGAFYHHFPSKQAIFVQILNEWLESLNARLRDSVARAPTVPDALRSMAQLIHHVFEEASGQLPMFLEFLSKARLDPDVWQMTISPYRAYRDYFAGLVEQGVAEQSLQEVDPDVAAQLIVSTAVGLLLIGLLDPEQTDWGPTSEACLQLLIGSIQIAGWSPDAKERVQP